MFDVIPSKYPNSVDNTEFGYLDGITSNIQTQLDSKGPSTVRLASDLVVTTNSIQDVTGLSFAVAANSVYSFNFDIHYDVAVAGTPAVAGIGAGFSVNCSGCVIDRIDGKTSSYTSYCWR